MKVLCTNGVKSVTATLIPDVERTIGLAVDVDYASTNMLMDKIVGGETGDLAVLSAEAIDGLIAAAFCKEAAASISLNPRSASRSVAARWRPTSAPSTR